MSAPSFQKIFEGEFSISDQPILNKTVDITFSVLPIRDVDPDGKIEFILPEGIKLVSGPLVSNVKTIKVGVPFTHTISIQPTMLGEWHIQGQASSTDKTGSVIYVGQLFHCYINVGTVAGEFSQTRIGTSTLQSQHPSLDEKLRKEAEALGIRNVIPMEFPVPSDLKIPWATDKKTIGISQPGSQTPAAPSGQESPSYLLPVLIGAAVIIVIILARK